MTPAEKAAFYFILFWVNILIAVSLSIHFGIFKWTVIDHKKNERSSFSSIKLYARHVDLVAAADFNFPVYGRLSSDVC